MKRIVILLIFLFLVLFSLICTASLGYNDEIFSFLKSRVALIDIALFALVGACLMFSTFAFIYMLHILRKGRNIEKNISRDQCKIKESVKTPWKLFKASNNHVENPITAQ